jgi:hypothetical protein
LLCVARKFAWAKKFFEEEASAARRADASLAPSKLIRKLVIKQFVLGAFASY